jgi:hypothetical protein
LDALASRDCFGDDVKCFVVCHQGTVLRWGANEMGLLGGGNGSLLFRSGTASGGSPASVINPPTSNAFPSNPASSSPSQQVSLPFCSKCNTLMLRGSSTKKAFLTATNPDTSVETMMLIAELQCSVLRSRLILTDAIVALLPQRVASVLTPVDCVTFQHHNLLRQGCPAPSPPSSEPPPPQSRVVSQRFSCLKLFEDPMVECVLRSHFVIARRVKLAAAFERLIAGDMDNALLALEDFSGDPTAADVCEWHAYRWRRWIATVRSVHARDDGGGTPSSSAAPQTTIPYVRHLEAVQLVSGSPIFNQPQ